MTDVKVEQCDKEEAHLLVGRLAMDLGINLTGDAIRDLFYASFARHRQAAEKAQQERDAGIAEQLAVIARAHLDRGFSEGDCRHRTFTEQMQTAERIATAIRSQGHE